MTNVVNLSFPGSTGNKLAAKIDLPFGTVRSYAILAHCFTCSKDLFATKRIASELSRRGVAVFRFDFTGLGSSDGDFADTNFSSNVEDLLAAVDYVEQNYGTVEILVGHSLGGAAVLSAAAKLPKLKAVATVGAPYEANHVSHLFESSIEEIAAKGEAEALIGGRRFKVKKQFLDDLAESNVVDNIAKIKAALMVMHSPTDQIVGVENAAEIFTAAKHPKSFVSLHDADHLLTKHKDAEYVAEVIAAWSSQFLPDYKDDGHDDTGNVVSVETMQGKFQNAIHSGNFHLLADEPAGVGGSNSGPSPYEFLAMSLASCTSMTLRMYSDRKNLGLGRIDVEVSHDRVHAKDCEECSDELKGGSGFIDRFERRIQIEDLDEKLKDKIVEIANKCPVHRTLEKSSVVVTTV